ncbi:MAG: hypothetical protein A3J59_01435 [Candidatus Buchananbacteria bacterium RIFCSPHIGHO2_02_FULL_56_16]|uniref:Nudix hydrolase domain-containing protein n=1 Tax=Candidatus Buchananbacteria bacterium RIFCSPHIGHO2_02_FULL_56_16 TaxID=1797542 RepID=A0A1G1YEH2_9BACT|nr:MAG: hypothetical protein A3J59_01435 [Candidatus Buchananbacteria bacterium RIFCSPHIGHO2_02_FULL_56_16]
MNQQPKVIVSAILIRKRDEKTEVFLQKRWKPRVSPTYSGMIEIPAGGIRAYENVYDALKREVKEECGLEIVRVVEDYQSSVKEPRKHDRAFVFKPFICQQVLETNGGLSWVGFVFFCEVTGEVSINPAEAKDPQWVTIAQLKKLVSTKADQIFPLQLPVLEYFITQFTRR